MGERRQDRSSAYEAVRPPLRAEEEWARLTIERVLGVPVRQHDDGTSHGMYDLNIFHTDGAVGAVEVTSDADGDSIALWKLLNDRDDRWIAPSLVGGWMVSLSPLARGRDVLDHLPTLLAKLESSSVRRVDSTYESHGVEASEEFIAMGVISAYQSGTEYPGSIYVIVEVPAERRGGYVAENGDALARWSGEFLRDEARQDVLRKLATSGREERHAFLILPGFSMAPFDVTDLLMRADFVMPSRQPDLPQAVTDLWIASTWSSGSGFRWSQSEGWTTFQKFDHGDTLR